MLESRLAADGTRRVNVLGVGVSAIDMRSALDTIDGWIERRDPHYVCVTSVHGVMESQRDEELRRIHNDAGLVTPDGMPLVWVGRMSGQRQMERVYGPDLMLACCERSLSGGHRHFFYGGGPGIAERLAERLQSRFPGLRVAGTYMPPFRPLAPVEEADVAQRIVDSSADIVWVGLGTPKQERWIRAHVGRVGAPVLVGVGAAFDFLSDAKRQAPTWMRQSGLEWVFRLGTEPRRLAERYLVKNPPFIWKVAMQAAGVRRYSLSSTRE